MTKDRRFASVLVLSLVIAPSAAWADDAPPTDTSTDPSVVEARREFTEGARLVRQEQWGEALAAFERAAKLKPHPITTHNVAQCERAMGQYTRARRALLSALEENERGGGALLPESVVVESRAILAELDKLLPRLSLTVEPADATLTVDGRPLERASDGTFVAGTRPPGNAESAGTARFVVIANPGPHVIVLSRRGYGDVVVNRSLGPGSTGTLELVLDRLPAQIRVNSNVADAVVRVNDVDVGNPPADVSRAAGRYHVVVGKRGFVSYDTEITLRPGEKVDLDATLRPEQTALTQRWWFWTGAGVLVAGAVVGTYFLTRPSPEPTRPPTDGGGLGWSLRVP